MVQVAIMGYGTIGSGVAEILAKNAEQIKNGCGQDVTLKYVLDLRDFPGSPVEDKIVHDFSVIEPVWAAVSRSSVRCTAA